MTQDKNNFLKFKEDKGGNVYFGDNGSAKICGKGMVIIGNRKPKADNVLLVENMKHSILNMSQMCDKKNTLTFDPKYVK